MTLYDSSVLIDYLDGDEDTVAYVQSSLDERAVAPPRVLFEVYQGEVYKTGTADFEAVDEALQWLTIVAETRDTARAAAELQRTLASPGAPLSPRDTFIAGTAKALGETLAVADADFDAEGIRAELAVDFVR